MGFIRQHKLGRNAEQVASREWSSFLQKGLNTNNALGSFL